MIGRWMSAGAALVIAALAGLTAARETPSTAGESKMQGQMGAATEKHVSMSREEVKWGPAPEGLPPGVQAAVIQGDPSTEGWFTVRLKTPKGYAIPPHFHPTAEYVTVLSGTVYLGSGDRIDKGSTKPLKAGGWVTLPATHHHWLVSDANDTVVQVHGPGPFAITYINPADDPRTKKQATK